MADYWETGGNANGADATTNGAQPAAGGDAMVEEILVSCITCVIKPD